MFLNNKADATLISWVLLVGLSITLAGIVINWAIQNVERFDPEQTNAVEFYCPDVVIAFDEQANIINRGIYNITKIRLARNDGTTSFHELIPPLAPYEKFLLYNILTPIAGDEIIPIINIQGQEITCNEKNIVV